MEPILQLKRISTMNAPSRLFILAAFPWIARRTLDKFTSRLKRLAPPMRQLTEIWDLTGPRESPVSFGLFRLDSFWFLMF